MERVAFLIEETNERLSCLLNPEGVLMRRSAGVKVRDSASGPLNASDLADTPLIYTGGGYTEIQLDLLFDVQLAGSSIKTEDVRNLTQPFWRMTEASRSAAGSGQLPIVRFIWGKYWNIPGVVVSVAERLEDFTPAGAARRSWLRLKMIRVEESAAELLAASPAPDIPAGFFDSDIVNKSLDHVERELGEDEKRYHQVLAGERLDTIAMLYYRNPEYWRVIARANRIADPNVLRPGTTLLIPALSFWARLIARFKAWVAARK